MASSASILENIFLIGHSDTQIRGNKLPSRIQVWKVLFFNMRQVKLTLRESARLVIKEVEVFWQKAQIPIHRRDVCIKKLENLYENWRILQKSAGKLYNLEKEKEFTSEHYNLFDIAHVIVDGMINDEKKAFLSKQREKGRIGYIGNVCTVHDDAQNHDDKDDSPRLHKRGKQEESKYF